MLMFVSRLAAFPLLEYLAWRYFRKPYMELQKGVEKGWGTFAGMTMLYYLLLVVMVQFLTNFANRVEYILLCVLVLVLMLFNYGTIFTALYRQLMLYREQQKAHILMEQKSILEIRLENQKRIRKMKHNMKGCISTLSGLLANGRIEESLTYLKGVEVEMDTLSGQFCANPYINAVFVHYIGIFEKIGARSRIDVQIGDEELPYMELCQILSNGLENACDALKGLEKEKREVSVQMKYNGNYLLTRIVNKCRDSLHVEQGSLPVTDKEGQNHGFGLVTIKEAAQRLDGEIFCYTEDGNFVLDVMVSCRLFPNTCQLVSEQELE